MVADCVPWFQLHGLCNMPEVRGLFRNNESLSVLPPAYPAFSLLFCPPSPKGKDRPPTPFPAGRGGGFIVFLCKGLRPSHSRA